MEEDNPLGLSYTPNVGDALQGLVNYSKGVARFYLKEVPAFFTGVRRAVKEESATPSSGGLGPEALAKDYSKSESRIAEKVASGVETLGLPEPVAGAAALAASTLLPGPAEMGLVAKGGAFMLGAVRATDPISLKLAGGVKTGQDIISPEQAKQLTKRSLEVQKRVENIESAKDALAQITGNIATASPAEIKQMKALRRKIKKEPAKLYQARSNVSVPTKEDPLYYGTTAAKKDRKALALTKGTTEILEEHHLFPKVASAAFFGKMDELIQAGKAELDDLVLMNQVAIAKGRKPGDYKSSMYLVEPKPHNEYHQIMKKAGDEFNAIQWAKIVDQAKDVDELLILWRNTLDDVIVPTAKDIQSYDKLDALLKEIRSSP